MAIGTVIVGAIAGGALVGTVAGALVAGAINLVVSFGIGAVVRAIQRRRQGEQADVVGVYGALRGGGVVPCSFIHGRWATAGSLAYREVWGEDGKTPNAYYVTVIALSDLPIQGLAGLTVNSQVCTVDLGATAAPQGVPISEFDVDGKDHLWVRFHDGSQGTADSYLVEKFGAHPDHPWSEDAVGTGIAYLVLTALVNDELFRGWPEYLAVVEGVRFYDLREDDTAGGAGDQRWPDAATHAHSANPLVAAYNILRGITYAGENFYGGKRIGAVNLPFSEWAAAMNACDEPVDLVAGGTEPQFVAGGEVAVDTPPANIIDELMTASAGRIAESGGIYKPYVGAPGAAVAAFSDGDIVVTETQEFEPFFDLGESINGISSRYISEAEGWQWKDAPPRTFPVYEAEDGGIRNLTGIAYGRVASPTQVQRLDEAAVHDSRRQRTHVLTLAPWLSRYEPGEVLAWTSARNGYSGKLFRIEKADDKDNLDYRVTLRETDPGDYDWHTELELPVLTAAPAVLRPPAQPLIGWAATGIRVVHDKGQRKAGVRLEWDPGVDDVAGVRFQIRLKATAALILDASTDAWEAGETVTTQNLASITEYQARGKYLPASPRPAEWSDWLDFTTPDARVSQAELDAAVDARLRQVEQQLPDFMAQLRAEIDANAGAIESIATTLMEEIGWSRNALGARYQEVAAGVSEVLLASATNREALAAFLLDLFAINPDTGAAHVNFRIAASAAPEGALAAATLQLRAGPGAGDAFATAALRLIAYWSEELGPYSVAELEGDRVFLIANGQRLPAHLLAVSDTPQPTPIVTGTPNTVTPNLNARRLGYHTLMTADAELQVPEGMAPGMAWEHTFQQDGSGGWDLTLGDGFISPNPTLASAANAVTKCRGYMLPGSLVMFWIEATASLDAALSQAGEILLTSTGWTEIEVPVHAEIAFELWGAGGASGAGGINSNNKGGDGEDTVLEFPGPVELRAGGGEGGKGNHAGGTGGSNLGVASGGNEANVNGDPGDNGSIDGAGRHGGKGGDAPDGLTIDGGDGGLQTTSWAEGLPGQAPGGGASGGASDWNDKGGGGGQSGGYVRHRLSAGALSAGLKLMIYVGKGGYPPGSGHSPGNVGAPGMARVSWT